jgi:hypothetical protein
MRVFQAKAEPFWVVQTARRRRLVSYLWFRKRKKKKIKDFLILASCSVGQREKRKE